METLLLVVHYFLCFFLVVVILLQAGKGADIGAAFGGASQTVFGSRGPATFLAKMTAVAAILFLATSMSLAEISKHRGQASVIDNAVLPEQTAPAPAAAEQAPTPEKPQ